MCSFFPIPADRFGTKHKNEITLTPENRKRNRERKHRAPTIKTVKKQRQIMDQIAEKKIKDIRNIIISVGVIRRFKHKIDNINLIAELCVYDGIFDDEDIAKIFIESFKERIFCI